jgi:hypothetical protein
VAFWWWELLESLSFGSGDEPTGAEAGDEDIFSLLGSCLAFEMSEEGG